ncbi:MAG TPA: tail fiber protein [Gemmataceae bacterium]|nr:tail fiber protein [Gemmataceae bacterium]HTZ03452.1 tail fiber protein [Xanthobacteraceae bacterium]
MADPYIGEIRCFGFNFAPYQWAQCNGQLTAISQNAALYSVLGTSFGGDGTTTFGLPNLQGQIPMHWGTAAGLPTTALGMPMGVPNVTLTLNQLASHNHPVIAATPQAAGEATGTPDATCFLGSASGKNKPFLKAPTAFNAPFSGKAIGQTGGSTPHDNMQPYLALNFCISLYGVFPSRS